MLGQDEHATDTKNWTSTNSDSELTNPLEMGKKNVRLWNRSILMSEKGVRSKLRCWAKMSMKQSRKILLHRIQLLSPGNPASEPRKPLEMVINKIQAFELLNSDVRAKS